MNVRQISVVAFVLVMATFDAAGARDFEMGGDNEYPNSIMAPESGTAAHHRGTMVLRRRHAKIPHAVTPLAGQPTHRNLLTARGSSGSVMPTPLPRTQLIPPEGGGVPSLHPAPQEQGPTIIPGTTTAVPNLSHGPETFQDRASRCAFQQGLNNVPAGASSQYMHACAM
jgi:hypothetical protein